MDETTQRDYFWLISDEAAPLLRQTQADFLNRINPVRIAKSLRTATTMTRSALVMEQAQLRIRSASKFEFSDRMFFTRRGLEQSTGEDIAAYKATRFDGVGNVADICCGIGGDLLGLLGRRGAGKTVGVDMDALTCLFAKHNADLTLQRLFQSAQEADSDKGVPSSRPDHSVTIEQSTFEDFELRDFEGVHCDPDRRMNERTVVGARFSPPLDEVLQRITPLQNLAIKVAPATRIPDRFTEQVQLEWIGDRRECKQLMIWSGPVVSRPGYRTATCVDGDAVHQLTVPDTELEQTIESVNQLRKYLFEPHPAVIAAGLVDVLAARCGAFRMAVDLAYLTSSDPDDHPLLSQFEIVDAFPMDLKRTIDYLRQHKVGIVEIKKRGVNKLVIDRYERMKLSGPNRATIILTRIGTRQLVAIARRHPNDF